ncbi:MAG TPA: hypothetical protein VLL96_02580 [Candidatus Deferrimicrobiaceae bacterium]|nr:hypothetical protein [Candidatus Deferrimicrobiaceae bacterium]
MLPHPIPPIPTYFFSLHLTLPIPTTTAKQPKQKNQATPQPKHGMGKLRRHPSSQKEKIMDKVRSDLDLPAG